MITFPLNLRHPKLESLPGYREIMSNAHSLCRHTTSRPSSVCASVCDTALVGFRGTPRSYTGTLTLSGPGLVLFRVARVKTTLSVYSLSTQYSMTSSRH